MYLILTNLPEKSEREREKERLREREEERERWPTKQAGNIMSRGL